jgi:hypothetical protein
MSKWYIRLMTRGLRTLCSVSRSLAFSARLRPCRSSARTTGSTTWRAHAFAGVREGLNHASLVDCSAGAGD